MYIGLYKNIELKSELKSSTKFVQKKNHRYLKFADI